jgi:Ca2+-binding EF-hand superfamily protein
MRLPLQIGLAVAVLASATHAQAQMRFQGMDANHDGVITRDEWRGNDRSFRNHDWDGDGKLSGDEVRPGARRQTNWSQDWNRDGRVDNYDSQILQRFRGYDMNNDNRVARGEWPGDRRLFTRLDTSRDGYLTIQEYTQGGGFNLDSLGGPAFRFSNLDRNSDGWITRNEWAMSDRDFDRLDINRDNRVSRFEFEHDTGSHQDYRSSLGEFNSLDRNRDGWVTRPESRMSNAQFDRLDTNNDNRVSRYEFENAASVGSSADEPAHSAAWRTGYDRGIQEGRVAGREDYVRNHGWDLEGQTELERADSGYTPQLGSLSDYQAGYREGFRNAYREGFYNARDSR